MIEPDIDYADLESILAICNHFQLVAVELSMDQEIIQVNTVAELLFLKSKKQLLNKSFHEICKEAGFTISVSNNVHTTQGFTADKKIIDATWTTSRILKEGECIGFLLVGKINVNHFDNQLSLRLEDLLSLHSIGVFSKNIDGSFISFNDYMAGLTGFKTKELTGKNDYLMPWAHDADIFRHGDSLVIRENSTIAFNEYLTAANGIRRCSYVTKSPLTDSSGSIIGMIGTAIINDRPMYSMSPSEYHNISDSTYLKFSEIYLTKKEIECVSWMIKGKSATEIANIIHVSPRTIETHLNNVKRKLNCFKQFQLGYLFGRYGHLLI